MGHNNPVIYLDNNATTPLDHRVLEAMMPFLTTEYANANSTHKFGVTAREAVKVARNQVATLIGGEPHEIVFTSGSTEAINLAIKGIAENYVSKGKHILTVKTEHSAVLDVCRYLETKGYEITYLSVQKDGLIDLAELHAAIRTDTILVSVMLANNETGVIQPIKDIAKLSHEFGAIFMTDATQAVGKIEVDVDKLGVDLLCLSGHKFYAPKGIGALYIRQRNSRIKLSALIHGGGHEKGMRSGTLNVPSIVALGHACAISQKEMISNSNHITSLRDYLESELLKIDSTTINGNTSSRLFNTTNILFSGADSDAIIMGLSNPKNDTPIIAISNGSACTSSSIEPSHVLTAMNLSSEQAFNCLRFSLSKFNTKLEIEIAISQVKETIGLLKAMVS